jgi:hypothetical protein
MHQGRGFSFRAGKVGMAGAGGLIWVDVHVEEHEHVDEHERVDEYVDDHDHVDGQDQHEDKDQGEVVVSCPCPRP